MVADVPVGRNEHIESGGFGGIEQFAVPERVPTMGTSLLDRVVGQSSRNASRCSVVEEDAHQRAEIGASRLRAANSRTALT